MFVDPISVLLVSIAISMHVDAHNKTIAEQKEVEAQKIDKIVVPVPAKLLPPEQKKANELSNSAFRTD